MNALLGRKVVRASRTPGKTKTLQTIYWNTHLRLCDCPGLVCPSSAGLERQVLAGILPIQNVEPVLRFIGQRIPLEKVLKLKHEDDLEEEKKQDEFSLDVGAKKEEKGRWTTDELLAAYADQQGVLCFITQLLEASRYCLRDTSSLNHTLTLHESNLQVSSPRRVGDQTSIAQERSFFVNCTLPGSPGDSDHLS